MLHNKTPIFCVVRLFQLPTVFYCQHPNTNYMPRQKILSKYMLSSQNYFTKFIHKHNYNTNLFQLWLLCFRLEFRQFRQSEIQARRQDTTLIFFIGCNSLPCKFICSLLQCGYFLVCELQLIQVILSLRTLVKESGVQRY
jgi:hypothetical protein